MDTESSGKSSPYTSKQHTQRTHKSTSSGVTDFQDTVHYLSPVTTAARTEYEGDLDYQQLFYRDLIHGKYDKGGVVSTASSTISCEDDVLQRTLAIIKPEAYDYRDVVLRAINKADLKVIHERTVHLTPEQVSEIYEKYYGMPTFPHMVVSMSTSPILVLALQAPNAVEKWKTMIGPLGMLREEWFFPYSIRNRFSFFGNIPQSLHASEGYFEACRENRYFFPGDVLEPLAHAETKVNDYITVSLKSTLAQGLAEVVRTKPIDPVLSLAEWLLLNNPYQPKMPDRIALTPT